ncbi:MAG: Re/Si-specific NAD(P)(+) transhydrogenase subunit alpha, partial [Legionella sp.]
MITTLLEQGLDKRVAITPNSAKNLIKAGYSVALEHDAGVASG